MGVPQVSDRGVIDYSNEKVQAVLAATVAKDASTAELSMFIEHCKASGLNPLKKEIWFWKDKQDRVNIMAGFHGFLKIANEHPKYEGMEVDEVFDEKGHIESVTVRVHRSDRKFPTVYTAYWREESQLSGNKHLYKVIPTHMLGKIAKSRGLRESFCQQLGGIYTEDEFMTQDEREAAIPVEVTYPEYLYKIPETHDEIADMSLVIDEMVRHECEMQEKGEGFMIYKSTSRLPDNFEQFLV